MTTVKPVLDIGEAFCKTLLNEAAEEFNTMMGWHYFNKYKHSEALVYFNKAVKCNPRNPKHYYNRAMCFIRLGRNKEAIESLQGALTIDPNYGLAKKVLKELVGASWGVKL